MKRSTFIDIIWWIVYGSFAVIIYDLPTWKFILALILAIALIFISILKTEAD